MSAPPNIDADAAAPVKKNLPDPYLDISRSQGQASTCLFPRDLTSPGGILYEGHQCQTDGVSHHYLQKPENKDGMMVPLSSAGVDGRSQPLSQQQIPYSTAVNTCSTQQYTLAQEAQVSGTDNDMNRSMTKNKPRGSQATAPGIMNVSPCNSGNCDQSKTLNGNNTRNNSANIHPVAIIPDNTNDTVSTGFNPVSNYADSDPLCNRNQQQTTGAIIPGSNPLGTEAVQHLIQQNFMERSPFAALFGQQYSLGQPPGQAQGLQQILQTQPNFGIVTMQNQGLQSVMMLGGILAQQLPGLVKSAIQDYCMSNIQQSSGPHQQNIPVAVGKIKTEGTTVHESKKASDAKGNDALNIKLEPQSPPRPGKVWPEVVVISDSDDSDGEETGHHMMDNLDLHTEGGQTHNKDSVSVNPNSGSFYGNDHMGYNSFDTLPQIDKSSNSSPLSPQEHHASSRRSAQGNNTNHTFPRDRPPEKSTTQLLQELVCKCRGIRFSSQKGLNNHRAAHYRFSSRTGLEKPLRCTACDGYFITRSSASYHCRQHRVKDERSVDELIVCTEISGTESPKLPTSDQQSSSKSHSTSNIPSRAKNYKCMRCPRQFTRLNYYRNHKTTHDPIDRRTGERKPFCCEHCMIYFNNSSGFSAHVRMYHPDNVNVDAGIQQKNVKKTSAGFDTRKCSFSKTTCRICKAMIFTSNLQNHLRIHDAQCQSTGKEKPYSCIQCPSYFEQKRHLSNHLNIGQRRTRNAGKRRTTYTESSRRRRDAYICTYENCQRQCKQVIQLKVHLAQHSKKTKSGDMKPHHCPRCDLYFSMRNHFYSHMWKYHHNQADQDQELMN